MRFASLGSGSRGNALLVEAGNTRVLVDAGFVPREISRRLARLNLTGEDVDAVLVTHEHADHVVPLGEKKVGEVASEESGGAGHDDAHVIDHSTGLIPSVSRRAGSRIERSEESSP